jgi:hypothetical protein
MLIIIIIILIITSISLSIYCILNRKGPDTFLIPGSCQEKSPIKIKECTDTGAGTNKFQLIREWQGEDLIPQNGKGWSYFESPTWFSGDHANTSGKCGDNPMGGGMAEPTHSRSLYVDGLVSGNFEGSTEKQLHIDVLSKTNPKSSIKSTINAVRLQSAEQFDYGLFIIDLEQIPHAQYCWPSFWLLGSTAKPNAWAENGEIDIIEGGWNPFGSNNINTSSLHTNAATGPECKTKLNKMCGPTGGDMFCGKNSSQACPYMGCSNVFPDKYINSFGSGFKGGVYACNLTCDGAIEIWFFTRNSADKYVKPKASDSGLKDWPRTIPTGPTDNSYYYLKITQSCKNSFRKMNMIINTAVGGDAFSGGARAKCPSWDVANTSIQDAASTGTAKWIINSIRVYQN